MKIEGLTDILNVFTERSVREMRLSIRSLTPSLDKIFKHANNVSSVLCNAICAH